MANRSTFSRQLPRNLGKLVMLSRDNPFYNKVQSVTAVDFNKDNMPLKDKDGVPFTRVQVLPDYDNMLRRLFIDAHKHHKGFKTQRLNPAVVADIKADAKADAEAAVVAS